MACGLEKKKQLVAIHVYMPAGVSIKYVRVWVFEYVPIWVKNLPSKWKLVIWVKDRRPSENIAIPMKYCFFKQGKRFATFIH